MVLANKQDLPHAAKPGEVAKGLGLEDQEIVRGREYAILGCSAIRGTGIHVSGGNQIRVCWKGVHGKQEKGCQGSSGRGAHLPLMGGLWEGYGRAKGGLWEDMISLS